VVQVRVCRALLGQQPDLRAVAVGQHKFVVIGKGGERRDRLGQVLELEFRVDRLAPAHGVPAQCGDDPHRTPLEQAFEKGVEHGLRSRQPVGGLQEHRPARTVDDVGEEGDQPLGTSTEGI
jgi:hypothetical protein